MLVPGQDLRCGKGNGLTSHSFITVSLDFAARKLLSLIGIHEVQFSGRSVYTQDVSGNLHELGPGTNRTERVRGVHVHLVLGCPGPTLHSPLLPPSFKVLGTFVSWPWAYSGPHPSFSKKPAWAAALICLIQIGQYSLGVRCEFWPQTGPSLYPSSALTHRLTLGESLSLSTSFSSLVKCRCKYLIKLI